MAQRARTIRLRRTGRVPADARVLDIDELSEGSFETVVDLAGRPRTAPAPPDLADCDVVKFTEYYLVRAR